MTLPPTAQLGKVSDPTPCRSCSAPIRFVTMAATGKQMPVDAELMTEHVRYAVDRQRRAILVTPHGTMIEGVKATMLDVDAKPHEGYVPHWGNCPNAAAHRKAP